MDDDIPVAQRHPSLGSSWPPVSRRRSWGWVLLGFLVGALLVVPALLSLRPQANEVPAEMLSPAVTRPPETPSAVLDTSQGEPSSQAVLGHFAHAEAPPEDLASVGTYHGRAVQLRPAAAQKFQEMAAAARSEGVYLIPISGFRSIADQEYLFFQRAQDQALRPQERALVSAPPGYSEHHTGYAVDIGDGTAPATALQESFETTLAFRWLQAHAARYGYELSFPQGNSQGVSYEPWHWRFVGDRHSLETFYSQGIESLSLDPLPRQRQFNP